MRVPALARAVPTALVAFVLVAAPALAQPPPPPDVAPPGLGDAPPPLEDPSSAPIDMPNESKAAEPLFARLAGKRFQLADSSAVKLVIACNSAFSAKLELRTGQGRSQRSSCASKRATLTFRFGPSLGRRLREVGSVRGTLVLEVNGGVLGRTPLTITRRRAVVRSDSLGKTAATPNYWPNSQAWMSCANFGHPQDEYINLRWHTYDGSVRWIYWRVWLQAYFLDSDVQGWHWKTPNGWNTAVPWYGPYRMNGFGIVELQQNQGGAFSNDPWIWRSDVLLSFHYYTRAVVQLWVWNGAWSQGIGLVQNDISTAGAPGWCDYT